MRHCSERLRRCCTCSEIAHAQASLLQSRLRFEVLSCTLLHMLRSSYWQTLEGPQLQKDLIWSARSLLTTVCTPPATGAKACHSSVHASVEHCGIRMTGNSRLTPGCAGESHERRSGGHLLLLGGDGGVAGDEGGHDPPGCLDAQRQRRHVQQQQVLHLCARLAPQDGRLRAGRAASGIHWPALLEHFWPAHHL